MTDDSVQAALAEQLDDSVQRVFARHYGPDARRRALAADALTRPAVWAELAELGLFALVLPEADGGLGADVRALEPAARRFGQALLVAPWLPSVLAGQVLSQAGTPAQRAALLPAIAAGEAICCVLAPAVGLRGEALRVTAQRAGGTEGGWRIDGSARFVPHAALASHVLVRVESPANAGAAARERVAASGGAAADGSADTPAWFLVAADAAGLTRHPQRAVDGCFCADLVFEGVAAEPLAALGADEAQALDDTLQASATAAVCGEALGLLEAAFDTTVAYVMARRQFGAALADNQAVRHRLAEMFIALEQVRSMAAAAFALCGDASAGRPRALAQAALVVGRSGRWIAQQAIQLHGGMGMTDDCIVGHHYRRLLMIDAQLGGEALQLERLSAA